MFYTLFSYLVFFALYFLSCRCPFSCILSRYFLSCRCALTSHPHRFDALLATITPAIVTVTPRQDRRHIMLCCTTNTIFLSSCLHVCMGLNHCCRTGLPQAPHVSRLLCCALQHTQQQAKEALHKRRSLDTCRDGQCLRDRCPAVLLGEW